MTPGKPWPKHKFLDSARSDGCLKCGRKKDHPYHSNRATPWVRKMERLIKKVKENPWRMYG